MRGHKAPRYKKGPTRNGEDRDPGARTRGRRTYEWSDNDIARSSLYFAYTSRA